MLTVDELKEGDIATFRDGAYTITGPINPSFSKGRLFFAEYAVTYEGGTPTDWALENFVSAERPKVEIPEVTADAYLVSVKVKNGEYYTYAYPTEIEGVWVGLHGLRYDFINKNDITDCEVVHIEN